VAALPTTSETKPFCDPAGFAVEAQGHKLTIYPGGQERLAALLGLIESAETSLKLAFYIFSRDASGARVRDALTDAVGRGVQIVVIVDGFGADADEEWFADMIAAGGTFQVFLAKWSRRALIRNHQKMVIADDKLAMMGGFNVADGYFAPAGTDGWTDIGLTIEGPVVARIADWFAQLHDWTRDDDAQFRDIRRRVKEWDSGTGPVRLLLGGPTTGLAEWGQCAVRDMQRGKRLDMLMAYFAPGPVVRKAMRGIARHGHTNLVLAGKSDNDATIGAARALYKRLLQAKARIFEFQPCKLHSKLIVIDDIVYLGSANFDMRSFHVNLEMMLRIEDAALAEKMREHIRQHIAASVEVTPELHARRATLLNRVRWWASWFLVSVVDYNVARRLNLGL
jgi:cardiolipin synthase